jgi:integrase
VTATPAAPSYRTRRRLVGFSYDSNTQLASLSAYVPGSAGRERKRKTVFAATYDDAVRLWTAFRERVKNRNLRPAVAPLFHDYIVEYFDDIAAQVSARSARDYRYAIDKHLLPFFGNRRLNEITTSLVKSFETKLKRRGYALATVNDYLNVVVMLLHRAVDDFDLIEEFPMKKRLRRKKPEPLALELTEDERVAFLSAFDDEEAFRADLSQRRVVGESKATARYAVARPFGGSTRPDGEAAHAAFARFQYLKPLFIIAIESGLRRGDLIRLSWRSVDFENRWIHIVMQKTKLPVTIPMSSACFESLHICLARARSREDSPRASMRLHDVTTAKDRAGKGTRRSQQPMAEITRATQGPAVYRLNQYGGKPFLRASEGGGDDRRSGHRHCPCGAFRESAARS